MNIRKVIIDRVKNLKHKKWIEIKYVLEMYYKFDWIMRGLQSLQLEIYNYKL